MRVFLAVRMANLHRLSTLNSQLSTLPTPMPDLNDGETQEMKGSGAKPYLLKNTGGVYSCTCPAWRNQSVAIEKRTCKHLRRLRGDAAQEGRVGGGLPAP